MDNLDKIDVTDYQIRYQDEILKELSKRFNLGLSNGGGCRMKKLDISEYDPSKKYRDDTEFILDDRPPDIPIPDFLKDKEKETE